MFIPLGIYISDSAALMIIGLWLLMVLFAVGATIAIARAVWVHRRFVRATRAANQPGSAPLPE